MRKQQWQSPDVLRYMVDEDFIDSLQGGQQKAKKIFDDALDDLGAGFCAWEIKNEMSRDIVSIEDLVILVVFKFS